MDPTTTQQQNPIDVRPVAVQFPEEFRLIGAIINTWNLVEHHLVLIVSSGTAEAPEDVYDEVNDIVSNRQRLRALRLAVLASAATQLLGHARYLTILDEAERCLGLRNARAHGILVSSVDTDDKLCVMDPRIGKKRKGPRYTPVTPETLRAELARLESLQFAVSRVLVEQMLALHKAGIVVLQPDSNQS